MKCRIHNEVALITILRIAYLEDHMAKPKQRMLIIACF